jgi:hypothetical protein
MIIYANLDQEARWSGLGLPAHVLRRISLASSLLGDVIHFYNLGSPHPTFEQVVEVDNVPIFAPAAVDPKRILIQPPPVMRVGVPPRWDVAWAEPGAKAVNDRRFALALARELGCALPGTRVIETEEEIDGPWPERWVAKAVWSAAGRDRARGEGPPGGELRARVANLVAHCPVVVEPWLERVRDVGVAGFVGGPPAPPHQLLVDARGGFAGIDRREPELTSRERAELDATVAAADRALARAGYSGPFTVDAFVHADGLHPLCELNARFTFGHVARALGADVLGFGLPPTGARVLVAPAADDPFTAWVA